MYACAYPRTRARTHTQPLVVPSPTTEHEHAFTSTYIQTHTTDHGLEDALPRAQVPDVPDAGVVARHHQRPVALFLFWLCCVLVGFVLALFCVVLVGGMLVSMRDSGIRVVGIVGARSVPVPTSDGWVVVFVLPLVGWLIGWLVERSFE
jgi:hypothetical protein